VHWTLALRLPGAQKQILPLASHQKRFNNYNLGNSGTLRQLIHIPTVNFIPFGGITIPLPVIDTKSAPMAMSSSKTGPAEPDHQRPATTAYSNAAVHGTRAAPRRNDAGGGHGQLQYHCQTGLGERRTVRSSGAARRAGVYSAEHHVRLGGCPRIESLLRKSGFWPIFPIKLVKYAQYSPRLIEKMASKPLPLATTSILGQPPRSLSENRRPGVGVQK
jgi:hypothetical protein